MDWSQSQTKLFRALLRCYPAEFRHEYGTEMEHVFTGRLQLEPGLRLWAETVSDLVLSALREHWHVLVSDLKYGARALASAPAFTAVALLVITLGIGATTAIFSLVNAVLLRSLPIGHPERLVYLWSPNSRFVGVPQELGPNVPDYYDWQRLSHSFSATTIFKPSSINLVRGSSVYRVGVAFVSGSFFHVLEASPQAGRTTDLSDDRPGHERVAVISDALWRSQFGSRQDTIGRQIQLNRKWYSVIGVMPKEFGYPFDGDVPYEQTGFKQTDIWLPIAYTADQKVNRVSFESADAVGRLRDGISDTTAQAELAAIESRLQPLYSEMWRGWTVLVRPLAATILGPVQKMFLLLLGAVAIVLLIAISNVANLLLARASVRSHELGIRTALGAERARIIRQLLTESTLLSCVGGALGLVLAYGAVRLLTRLNPGGIPRFDTATVDGRVLLLVLVLVIVTGLLSGIVPALSASRISILDLLRKGGSRVAGRNNRTRYALIIIEVALSVILLAGSGLLIRSYLQLAAVDPGFSSTTLTFGLNLDERYGTRELQSTFYKVFLEKLQNLASVRYAGASNSLPLSNEETVTFANIRGYGKSKAMVENRLVTPDYRRALGTVLLRGRDLTSHDINSKMPVVLINQKFAEVYFHGRDPLGGQLTLDIGNNPNKIWSTVVGVVGNIRHTSLEEESQAQVFEPAGSGDNFAVLSTLPTQTTINQARTVLHSMDATLTLEKIATMGERISNGNARRRFQTSLLTGFAATALTLALMGLYGLISYSVMQRRTEIGIRLAVGASRAQVLLLVVKQGFRPTCYGLVIGLVGALAATRLINNWLYDVKAIDPATFIAIPVFVLAVAMCACLLPAWSATRIDPVQALRTE